MSIPMAMQETIPVHLGCCTYWQAIVAKSCTFQRQWRMGAGLMKLSHMVRPFCATIEP